MAQRANNGPIKRLSLGYLALLALVSALNPRHLSNDVLQDRLETYARQIKEQVDQFQSNLEATGIAAIESVIKLDGKLAMPGLTPLINTVLGPIGLI
jgi:ABC-type transporter lipoprotein component MlaA